VVVRHSRFPWRVIRLPFDFSSLTWGSCASPDAASRCFPNIMIGPQATPGQEPLVFSSTLHDRRPAGARVHARRKYGKLVRVGASCVPGRWAALRVRAVVAHVCACARIDLLFRRVRLCRTLAFLLGRMGRTRAAAGGPTPAAASPALAAIEKEQTPDDAARPASPASSAMNVRAKESVKSPTGSSAEPVMRRRGPRPRHHSAGTVECGRAPRLGKCALR